MRAVAIKSNRPGGMKVKASGGVGTFEAVTKIVNAGAERVGASKTGAIVQGFGGGITQQSGGDY
jgi:deoxyribose-phosphate aldolase